MTRPVQLAKRFHLFAFFCLLVISVPSWAESDQPADGIEFNREIRPLLSDRCFACHGPDEAKRAADLRLDDRTAAIAKRDHSPAIVPLQARMSELIRRVESNDESTRMPPPSFGPKLSPDEVALLKRWIDEGADYQPHWSFVLPRRSLPRKDLHSETVRSPIDAFVQEKLGREGLNPTPEADRATLIRRLSFDLVGLPPTPGEVASFLADSSPDACERLVDRLLASPRYGERMATNWLDAARYADTNGYQTDGPRFMWRWRDWVINAFNQNLPFDQFTLDQLAGDLREARVSSSPSPEIRAGGHTEDDLERQPSLIANDRLIATGFNRNHRGNAEGGIIPEEFRIEYVVDRVETTSTVWLGLTIGCARCHDHKYDPISQREFYQLFAYFNQVPEPGKYIRNGNSMPYLPAPTADQLRHLSLLEQERTAADAAWQGLAPSVLIGMRSMVDSIRGDSVPVEWSYTQGLDSHLSFDGGTGIQGAVNQVSSQSRLARDLQIPPAELDSPQERVGQWHDGEPTYESGPLGQAATFDGRRWIDAGIAGYLGEDESFVISCWVKPQADHAMTILARMDHENSSHGYELRREANGRLRVLLSGRILDDLIRVETEETLPKDEWTHLLVTYDGSSAARGVAVRMNGEPRPLKVLVDLLSNPIRAKVPLRVGGGGSAAPFVGSIDELRFYRGRITSQIARSLASGESISAIATRTLETLGPNELEKLREYYLAKYAPEVERQARQHLLDARTRYAEFLATVPTTMVMEDAPNRRETRLLKRGEYDKPGEVVESALPAILSNLTAQDSSPVSTPSNRLDLATWLVSPENPLTARVTVNRLWQSLFGIGLVKTSEDFGIQGEAPSHPALLDWLAIEFSGPIASDAGSRFASPSPDDASHPGSKHAPFAWDLKKSLRTIVTSATYRQAATVSPDLLQRDPENRLLARGPRVRLPAEMVRDAALSASGLLAERLGGPSVKPYQPAGLWEELSAEAVPGPFSVYVQDHGADLYRRSIYTYRKRTAPPPAMTVFDSSTREACRVSLPRTNTPIQALNLMNDVTYVEAARVLAEQAIAGGGTSAQSRIDWAFRRILSRSPGDRELNILTEGFERRRTTFQAFPEEVEKLISLGETPPQTSIPPVELAAYTATISVIFNLDEFVVKP
ncbi:DUF1553 domain-containing protein [Schlesneria sp. T3-172]|uniref:DUF1553 domain-containing protein n=1 Tax=Schlesneria sphaerica TaxID=3373610 RepID=UPI0037C9F607